MITLWQGDCLELMKDIPDHSVDCIICDLPYGSLKSIIADGWKSNGTSVSWDKLIDLDELFLEYNRILRQNGAIILFNKEPLTTAIRNISCQDIEHSFTYVWKKSNFANPYLSKSAPLSICEFVDVYYKKYSNGSEPYDLYRFSILNQIGESKKSIIDACGESVDHFFRQRTKQFISEVGYSKLINVYHIDQFDNFIPFEKLEIMMRSSMRTFNIPIGFKYITDFIDIPKDSKSVHPTQKPVSLIEFFISVYSNSCDTVLDPTMGSGTTGVACKNLKRNFIGIELDKDYFEIAKNRIDNTHTQYKLFD
jgi:site-specific DNA-methyltransferase (adenine-specific)